MARIPAWLNDIAEKYVQEIVAGVTGRVTYKDAWLESDCIIVPTQNISSNMEGWQAWKLPVVINKKGYKYGVPVETVIGEPSVYAFTQWAKDQAAETLRDLLATRGITATGDLVSILAYRLAYEYEKVTLTKTGQYVETTVRRDHIAALDTLLNTEGRGKHPNELAIVLIREALKTGKRLQSLHTIGANDMKDESPSEIRKRLLAEKETQEKAKPAEAKKKDAKVEPEKKKSGKVAAESDAIKKGKGGKTVVTPEPDPEPVTTNDTEKETEDMSKKKGAKKAGSKKAVTPKAAKTGKGGLTDAKKEIPLGSIVKYIGDRNPKLKGKTGEVLRYSGPNGVAIKYKDGLVGTASPTALEMVTKGKSK